MSLLLKNPGAAWVAFIASFAFAGQLVVSLAFAGDTDSPAEPATPDPLVAVFTPPTCPPCPCAGALPPTPATIDAVQKALDAIEAVEKFDAAVLVPTEEGPSASPSLERP